MAEITERTIEKVGKSWYVVTRFNDGTEEKAGPYENRATAREEYKSLGGAVKKAADGEKKGVDAA